MKGKSMQFAALIAAAMAAMANRHYMPEGYATNRREWRNRFKKRKGGGHGLGGIDGLPRVAVLNNGAGNWHMSNRAGWRRPRVPKAERTAS